MNTTTPTTKSVSLALVIALTGLTSSAIAQGPKAVAPKTTAPKSQETKPALDPTLNEKYLEKLADRFLNDKSVAEFRVKVDALPNKRFAIHIYPNQPEATFSPARITEIKNSLGLISGDLVIISHLTPTAAAPTPATPDPIIRVQTLRFLRTALPDQATKNTAKSDIDSTGTDEAATKLAEYLNGLFPDEVKVHGPREPSHSQR